MSYKPVTDGIEKKSKLVTYLELSPPVHLSELVHCYWELKTEAPLPEDFNYHILPDACVNILFDQVDPTIAAITAIHTKATTLNLGRSFHYVGVQLLPGVWRGDSNETMNDLVDQKYEGSLNLIEINAELANLSFSSQQNRLSIAVEKMIKDNLIVSNPITAKILFKLTNINTVSDMADATNMSSRQLQRKLKQTTGFTPHDFLKVIRLQQSFRQNYLDYYVDQSHFIHSFRQITGYTPGKYAKQFNV